MKSPKLVLCASVLGLLLMWAMPSCSRNQTMAFYAEDFWWEFLDRDGSFREKLVRIAQERGYLLSIVRSEGKAVAAMSDEGSIDSYRLVVVSPFASAGSSATAQDNSNTLILVFGYRGKFTQNQPIPPNLAYLYFDRRETYQRAGKIIGSLLSSPQKVWGKNASSLIGGKAGILVLPLTEGEEAEVSAFRTGFLERADKSRLIERRISDTHDRSKVKKLLEEMKTEGVFIYLLKTFELTGYCLEFLQKEGGLAIVEDWKGPEPYRAAILVSVEEDYIRSLEQAFSNISRITGSWKERTIPGYTLLNWNKEQEINLQEVNSDDYKVTGDD